MKHVPLSTLEAKIIRPGFEQHLKPLLRFKGNQTLGRLHRMWNLILSGMEHEATAADITQRLVRDPAYSKLCGPVASVSLMSIRSLCGRLTACSRVMDEAPGLEEYIDWLLPPYQRGFALERLSDPPDGFAQAVDRRSISWAAAEFAVSREVAERWFREMGLVSFGGLKRRPDEFVAKATGKTLGWAVARYNVSYSVARRWFDEVGVKPKRELIQQLIAYPFLIHDGGGPEHALLRKVSGAVPQGIDPSLRADMCQDLLVGILAGDLSENDLALPTRELSRRIWKSSPHRYGDVSIDTVIAGDDWTIMDTLADEGRDWA